MVAFMEDSQTAADFVRTDFYQQSPSAVRPWQTSPIVWTLTRQHFSVDDENQGLRLLTPQERERYESYTHRDHGIHFLMGRLLLRVAAAVMTDSRAQDWIVHQRAAGDLELSGPVRMHCSLSRSTDLAACVLNTDRPVGFDVEDLRRSWDFNGIAKLMGFPEQVASIAEDDGRVQFFTKWTDLESKLKYFNMGLTSLNPGASMNFSMNYLPEPVRQFYLFADQRYLASICGLKGKVGDFAQVDFQSPIMDDQQRRLHFAKIF